MWGEGIEIAGIYGFAAGIASLPVWGEGIEIDGTAFYKSKLVSLPVWGAWIEITPLNPCIMPICVAPRMGSVD